MTSAEEGLTCLWEYVKRHGTARVPRSYKTPSGFLLGEWVNRRRKLRGQDPTVDQLLESLPGWTWVPYEQGFAEQLDRYKKAAETGHLARYRALRVWASQQRRAARTGKLLPHRLELLRAAGVLDVHMHADQAKMMCTSRVQG
jgi:hypothetical protein